MKKIIKNKMKRIFLNLKIQNGEYEYNSKSVHTVNEGVINENFAQSYASIFYDKPAHRDGDVHYFHGGEVAVKVYEVKDISEEEFNVLSKFL